MRLRTLTVRNYRLHKKFTLELDPARNLVGGDNESGKSTLAEAIHRALFFRHRSGGEIHRSMVSDQHHGSPEVDLVFEVGKVVWTLEKIFTGNSRASVRLISDAGENLTGDAAEERLAILTGNVEGEATSAKQLATRWAHLWVWQGQAADDASGHAGTYKDDLVRRLQEQGLAAVMQSATDERVRESVRATYVEMYTGGGLIKAGSKLDRATKELAESEIGLSRTREMAERLEVAVADQRAAEAVLEQSKELLPRTRIQLAAVQADLNRARDLLAEVNLHEKEHTAAAAEHARRVNSDTAIHRLQAEATAARHALAPEEERVMLLAARAEATTAAAEAAEKSKRATEDALRQARHLRDLAAACLSEIEKGAELAALRKKTGEVATIEESLREQKSALGALPAITPAALDELRKSEARYDRAKNKLETIAAGIEIIEAGESILLDGESLSVGESRIITESAELTLGSGTRLRIRPGGGTSLEDARRELASASRELSEMLDQLGISDLEKATEISIRRLGISREISEIESRLSALGAKELPDQLAAAESAADRAKTDLENRRANLSAPLAKDLPSGLEEARAFLKTTEEDLEDRQEQENTLRQQADAARAEQMSAASALVKKQTAINLDRQKLRDLEITASTHESTAGDASARQQAITEASAAEAAAKTRLDLATTALAGFHPEELSNSETRLNRIIEQEQTKQSDAERRIAFASSTLAQDGTRDPAADLLIAIARRDSRAEEHARENRRAEAIKLLHGLFEKSQAAIGASLTAPIAERVSRYLKPVMGQGVAVGIDLTDPLRPSLDITRPGDATAFSFAQLSGGAKEQVAAAVRLAMAEILATGHNGCLPILFDDAFVNADPDRAQAIQIMLDEAANEGLQIIVLSCTPADYHGLGAKETLLRRPRSA